MASSFSLLFCSLFFSFFGESLSFPLLGESSSERAFPPLAPFLMVLRRSRSISSSFFLAASSSSSLVPPLLAVAPAEAEVVAALESPMKFSKAARKFLLALKVSSELMASLGSAVELDVTRLSLAAAAESAAAAEAGLAVVLVASAASFFFIM